MLTRCARHGVTAFAALVAVACGGADFDIVLRNGTVIDGTGRAPYEADVAITDGRIVRIGDLDESRGAEDVDASGHFVVPGFINLHSHDRLDAIKTARNLLEQGVTTIILNADGGGPLDVATQLAEAESGGLAVNVGSNVGFNAAWSRVNGSEETRPSTEQLAQMRALVETGLGEGAWGVSAGLDYKPTYYARTDEVVTVLRDMEEWRTVFTNHDRLIPETGFSSRVGMAETIEIGERTGLMPLITHMKIQGREQGTSEAVLGMMREATSRGAYTAADAYPYLAGQTGLGALIIPGWAQAGGRSAMLGRFADPEARARIIAEADEAIEARFGGPSGVFLPDTRRELTDVMAEMELASGGETVVRLLEEENRGAILRFGSEEDLAAILAHPTTSISCDCDAAEGAAGHPRAYGTFPRALGRYVRELGVLSWEEAVHKMTGLPAATIGMVDRGVIAVGMWADIAVFDPETVIDRATYMEPALSSVGVTHVLVNGEWALRDGAAVGAEAGRALRRSINMPARPAELMADRSALLVGTLSVEDQGVESSWELLVDVRQAEGARSATGDLILDVPNGQIMVTQIGVLQVADRWASFTGIASGRGIDGRPGLVILDGEDPSEGRSGTTVIVAIEGRDPIVGKSSDNLSVRSAR